MKRILDNETKSTIMVVGERNWNVVIGMVGRVYVSSYIPIFNYIARDHLVLLDCLHIPS